MNPHTKFTRAWSLVGTLVFTMTLYWTVVVNGNTVGTRNSIAFNDYIIAVDRKVKTLTTANILTSVGLLMRIYHLE